MLYGSVYSINIIKMILKYYPCLFTCQVLEGSVVVVLTLVDTNSTTEGANVTILIGQITQDVS